MIRWAFIRTTVGMPRSKYTLNVLTVNRRINQSARINFYPLLYCPTPGTASNSSSHKCYQRCGSCLEVSGSIRCNDMRPLALSLRHRTIILSHTYSRLTQASKYYSSFSKDAEDGPTCSAFGVYKTFLEKR